MAKRSQEISNASIYSKFKDALYKVGDLIIIAVILVVMYFGLTNKLNEIMPISFNQLADDVTVNETLPDASGSTTDDVVHIDINKDDESNDSKEPSTNSESTENQQESNTTGNTETEANDNKEAEENNNSTTETETANDTPSDVFITINIPPGSTAIQVAEILYDNKIIAEKGLFLTKINDMKIANRLLAGSFKLKKGMTYEDIAKILTGQM